MNYQTMKRCEGILRGLWLCGKKPILRGYILYGSNYMTFWKSQNYGDKKKISLQGFGESRDEQVEYRGFLGQWKYSVY